MKLPYNNIQERAWQLIEMMCRVNSLELRILLWDEYLTYLESCGWTDKEFDVEVLHRVDTTWDPILN